jgi:diguanylate cyclase (GGDEF)-like protein
MIVWFLHTYVLDEYLIFSSFALFLLLRNLRARISQRYIKANTVQHLDIINFKLFKKALIKDITHQYNGNTCVVSIGFNRINSIDEQYGPGTYDSLMKEATLRLKTTLRNADILGKSHKSFLILLTDLNTHGSYKFIIKRIIKLLNKPYKINGVAIKISAHAGIMNYSNAHGDVLELIKIIDMAMYTAKIKNLDYFFPDAASLSQNSMKVLPRDLKFAVQNDQFILHYQPKKDVRSGEIIGVEALLRWQHPKYGLISPDNFIQVSNTSDLSSEVTSWVAKKAIKNCADLRELGYDLSVSINVSANDLINSDLLVTLVKAIDKYQLEPGKVIMEITEVSLLQDLDMVSKLIVGLDVMGIQISLDDFDPNQLTLIYSKQLPLKELKLDRSLIYELLQRKVGTPSVEDIIQLAHNYGATIVAEKIETAEDEKKFADLGCDVIQGYHIAAPLPFDELANWLKASPQGSQFHL